MRSYTLQQDLIATNARVAQNQDDYNVRYEALVSQYEATKAERDRVAAEIRQKGIRRREFERFITTLLGLIGYTLWIRNEINKTFHKRY